MRRSLLSIIIASSVAIILTSCDADIAAKRQIYLISVTSDYRDQTSAVLNTTNHDQYGLVRQILTLDDTASATLFLSFSGYRYILSNTKSSYILPDEENITKTALDVLPHRMQNWNSRDVLNAIEEITEKAGENDLIIFQYSGHGAEKTGEMILSFEAQGNAVTITDSISSSEILNAFSASKALTLLIMDSCYSGSYIKENVIADGNVFKNDNNKEYLTSVDYFEGIGRAFSILRSSEKRMNPNIYVLSASSEEQTSWDCDPNIYKIGTKSYEKFGGFTFYLLKALGYDPIEDEPHIKGSRITLYSLYEDIWNSMKGYHKSEATPLVTLSPLDIILFNP